MSRRAAEVIVAEIGTDMSRFPTAGHLARGRGCARATTRAPASGGAAGRPRGPLAAVGPGPGGVGGQPHQGHDPRPTYRRWVKRLGRKRALVALGHKILVLVYTLMSDGTEYQERLEPAEPA